MLNWIQRVEFVHLSVAEEMGPGFLRDSSVLLHLETFTPDPLPSGPCLREGDTALSHVGTNMGIKWLCQCVIIMLVYTLSYMTVSSW